MNLLFLNKSFNTFFYLFYIFTNVLFCNGHQYQSYRVAVLLEENAISWPYSTDIWCTFKRESFLQVLLSFRLFSADTSDCLFVHTKNMLLISNSEIARYNVVKTPHKIKTRKNISECIFPFQNRWKLQVRLTHVYRKTIKTKFVLKA